MIRIFKIILFATIISPLCFGSEVSDLKQLGTNKGLLKRARKIDPESRYRVVQKRLVDRNTRLELGLSSQLVAGGDAYFDTFNLGAQIDFHINPRWSIGGRYYKSTNTLTKEGLRVHEQAEEDAALGRAASFPAIDPPETTLLATLSYYPIYGKLNFFNVKTIQFDIYGLLGAGTIDLIKSGQTLTYTGGMGAGFWFNNRVTARLEVRYQGYQDTLNDDFFQPRQMNLVIAGLTLGILL